MEKPTPDNGRRGAINFIDMCRYIDEKYEINQRDYSNRDGFNWVETAQSFGLSEEDARRVYTTKPAELTEEEATIVAKVWAAQKTYKDEHPYQDFWQFQIDLVNNFSNDVFLEYPLHDALACTSEQWQTDIAQLWLDEWREYMDEYGTVFVWVSW